MRETRIPHLASRNAHPGRLRPHPSQVTGTAASPNLSGPAQDGELRPPRRLHVVERCAVRLAHLARDVETEPGASRGGGEEWFEQLRPRLEDDPRPVVHHVQFYNTARALERGADHDAGGAAAAMPQRVAAEVPHHLVEMAAVEQDVRGRGQLDAKHAGIDLLDLGELLDEAGQKIGQPEALTMRG